MYLLWSVYHVVTFESCGRALHLSHSSGSTSSGSTNPRTFPRVEFAASATYSNSVSDPHSPKTLLEFPSVGGLKAQLVCHGNITPYGKHTQAPFRACHFTDQNTAPSGALHRNDYHNTPLEQTKDLRGTAIATAWSSDEGTIRTQDFMVVSTVANSPWLRAVEYDISPGLPPCPPGVCLSLWGWIHSPYGGEADEMFMTANRCEIKNPDIRAKSIPLPKVATKCMGNLSKCVKSPKNPHYWFQKERNNSNQPWSDPPYYNMDYGFQDGAQTDLWYGA